MRVVELRLSLAERGLDTKGTKPVLVERLSTALEAETHRLKRPQPLLLVKKWGKKRSTLKRKMQEGDREAKGIKKNEKKKRLNTCTFGINRPAYRTTRFVNKEPAEPKMTLLDPKMEIQPLDLEIGDGSAFQESEGQTQMMDCKEEESFKIVTQILDNIIEVSMEMSSIQCAVPGCNYATQLDAGPISAKQQMKIHNMYHYQITANQPIDHTSSSEIPPPQSQFMGHDPPLMHPLQQYNQSNMYPTLDPSIHNYYIYGGAVGHVGPSQEYPDMEGQGNLPQASSWKGPDIMTDGKSNSKPTTEIKNGSYPYFDREGDACIPNDTTVSGDGLQDPSTDHPPLESGAYNSHLQYVTRIFNYFLCIVKYFLCIVTVPIIILLASEMLPHFVKQFLTSQAEPGTQFAKTIRKLQTGLCQDHYTNNFFKVNLVPWSNDPKDAADIGDVYINQTFHTEWEEQSNILDFFLKKSQARRLLLEAEQGEGKTTAIKAMTFAWCKKILSDKYQENQLIKYQRKHLLFVFAPVDMARSSVMNQTRSILQDLYMRLVEMYFRENHPLEPIPELILSFEFKDLCSQRSITDTVVKLIKNVTNKEILDVLDKGSKTILFAFDGYDENNRLYVCKSGIEGTEVDSIIKREARKNFNLLVTSRPWRSEDLLNIPRYGFVKMSMITGNKDLYDVRNQFIKNFFSILPPSDMADNLIQALDGSKNIVPTELQNVKRMLLYVCNIWKDNQKKNTEENFFIRDIFLNDIWELMRRTYNMKYPEARKSKENLMEMRKKIGLIEDEELSHEEINQKFGDEEGFDVFYFGIYSTAIKYVGGIGEKTNKTTIVKVPSSLKLLEQEEKLKERKKKEKIFRIEEELATQNQWQNCIIVGILSFVLFTAMIKKWYIVITVVVGATLGAVLWYLF